MKLTAAGALAAVPFVAARLGEASTGWVDRDSDGMLDGFVNGAYDWMDINGGTWLRIVGLLVIVILALTIWTLRRFHARPASINPRRHPWMAS